METEEDQDVTMLTEGSNVSGPGKIVIGSAVVMFAIATIFWGGATYDRVGEIEKHLSSLDNKLSTLEVVPVLQRDQNDHERRIQKLEEYLRKNP